MIRRFVILLAVVALMLASFGGFAEARRTHRVRAGGSEPLYTWEPSELKIKVGHRVLWINNHNVEHHVLPYAGPWPKHTHIHLEPGGRADFVFKRRGTFKYYCDYHAHLIGDVCIGQCGTIKVRK